jgi:hypothetical protein
MNNSAQRSRAGVQEKCGHGHRRRHSKVYGSVPKTVESTAIVPSEPKLRIAPAALSSKSSTSICTDTVCARLHGERIERAKPSRKSAAPTKSRPKS